MARNQEKSQSILKRYISYNKSEQRLRRRPYLASDCRNLPEAQQWRGQIMQEIGRKVLDIQNEGLNEHTLRDLNDEINKLIREAWHWEKRIVELGGPSYTNNSCGRGPGYMYFGAAKKLPGVKELFEKPGVSRKRITRHKVYKRIDASYYGYIDDDDGILEKLEEQCIRGVKEGIEKKNLFEDGVEEEEESDEEFVVHVPMPEEKEIERMVVQRKKMELMKKYVSEDLMEEEREAKAMLNIQR